MENNVSIENVNDTLLKIIKDNSEIATIKTDRHFENGELDLIIKAKIAFSYYDTVKSDFEERASKLLGR